MRGQSACPFAWIRLAQCQPMAFTRVPPSHRVRPMPASSCALFRLLTILFLVAGGAAADPAATKALDDWIRQPAAQRPAAPPATPLDLAGAKAARARLWQFVRDEAAPAHEAELEAKLIEIGGSKLRWMERVFGKEPPGGHSLWISMHGGGGAPTAVNDRQWKNQIKLYEPAEGIYIAPRAPSDAWNMWHTAQVDPLFDRLIAVYTSQRKINPERVYLMGYSAGGDGVYQVGARFADRWAAAAMMAGHPNETSPLSLRNLPFALFCGGADAAYNRNKVTQEWGTKLEQLAKDDPGGYPHAVHVYDGLPHWMNKRDAEALPWMAAFTRQTWPKKIVWHQDDVTHDRFYWLALPPGSARKGQDITAEVKSQTIEITAKDLNSIVLRLADDLLNLEAPVTVKVNGQEKFTGRVDRTAPAILTSLRQRSQS
jgi:poly(3-hydroxybutyrate) depolymerase